MDTNFLDDGLADDRPRGRRPPDRRPPDATIYLDCHSTTPVSPEVLAEMLPCFGVDFGNPGSESHRFGQRARELVDAARQAFATQLGCEPDELLFTSGATEANNLAIFGSAARWQGKRRRIVTAGIEHPSVLEPLQQLARGGWEVVQVPVHGHRDAAASRPADPRGIGDVGQPGRVDIEALREVVDERTALVTIAVANNEIGSIQPIAEIAEIAHAAGAWLHTDASQAVGWLSLNVRDWRADLVSFSGHKCFGPKGVGALYVRRRGLEDAPRPIRLVPQTVGGGQEFGLRAGTLNAPGIVGMAAAVRLANQERLPRTERVVALRQRLWERLVGKYPDLQCNGPDWDVPGVRLPNNVNFAVPGVSGESIMLHSPGLAMSSGSACSSANPGVSTVLLAVGLTEDRARCSLRLGLSHTLEFADIESAAEQLIEGIELARSGGLRSG